MEREWMVAAALAVGWFGWMMTRGPSLPRLIQDSIDGGNAQPILDAASQLQGQKRSFFYQQAIQRLWDGYHRELAAQVIQSFAMLHSDQKICQFWLRQLLELESEIARKTLDQEFLDVHYQPEVAACCGVASS